MRRKLPAMVPIMERIRQRRLLEKGYKITSHVKEGGILTEKYFAMLLRLHPTLLQHDCMVDLVLDCVDLLHLKYTEISYEMLMGVLIAKATVLSSIAKKN